MSLWLIIYTAGQIGGVVGPLPYDMAECHVRRDELRVMQADGLARGTNDTTGLPLTQDERAGIVNLSFECEHHETRPEIQLQPALSQLTGRG